MNTSETEALKMFDEKLIEHMVNRFLGWKLPENFSPDAGISFRRYFNQTEDHSIENKPTGTNLFDAIQAKEMVKYLLSGSKLEETILTLLTPSNLSDNHEK